MGTHRTVVCLGALTGFLTVVCLALAGVLVWREVFLEPSADSFDPTDETQLRQRFPGFFRTPEEKEQLERVLQNFTFTPGRNVSTVYRGCLINGKCEQSTPSPNSTAAPSLASKSTGLETESLPFCPVRPPGDFPVIHNACCKSNPRLIDPTSLPTGEPGQNGNVTIVQRVIIKQYFQVEDCCQVPDCNFCQCRNMPYITSAYTLTTSDGLAEYKFQKVKVPGGSCKCINLRDECDG